MTEKTFVEDKRIRGIVNGFAGLSLHIVKNKASGLTNHRITRDDYKHGAMWVEIRDKDHWLVWFDGDVGLFLDRKAKGYFGENHHVTKGRKVWRFPGDVGVLRVEKLCALLNGAFISRGDLK